MKKSWRLKELKNKLKVKSSQVKILEKEKVDCNGRIDYEISLKIQNIETDVYQIRKQIDFIKKGKSSYLGDAFEDNNINEYTK